MNALNDTYLVFYPAYNAQTERYDVKFQLRRGADVLRTGTAKCGYLYPFQAATKAKELNDAQESPEGAITWLLDIQAAAMFNQDSDDDQD